MNSLCPGAGHYDVAAGARRNHLPWLFLFFLTTVFFVNYHDLTNNYHSLAGQDTLTSSVDDIATAVDNGSLVRQISLLSLLTFALVSLLRHRGAGRLVCDSPLSWLIVSFVVWAFISPLWADDILLTIRRLVVFGILCIAAVVVARYLSLRDVIWWSFLSTLLFLFAGVVAEMFYGTLRPFTPGYRFAGTLHPNGQGIECGLLVLSALALAEIDKRHQALFRGSALLGFVFLILTASRTAITAAVIAVGIYIFTVQTRRARVLMACSIGVICCSVLLFVGAASPKIKSSLELGREDAGDADSFNGRTTLWRSVGRYIRQRPILGYGYCGFWTPTHVRAISDEEGWAVPNSHSAYIEYLAGLGIVGLGAYASMLVVAIRRAFRSYTLSRSSVFAHCGALLVFYAVDSLLEAAESEGSLIMFLCMVMLVRLAFLGRPDWTRAAHT